MAGGNRHFKSLLRGAILLCVLAVIGCEFPKVSTPKNERPAPNSQDQRNAYGGVYYRIQANYQLIETGEPLNFDFIVSCYNREVPGSFHGILKPTTMFKATSTGSAIAISPPKHYCQRRLNGMSLEREDDLVKMPLLSWYPDVTDLSYTLVYMTNDAYLGPKAEVQFKGYEISTADKAAFVKWEAQTLAEYEQIGAIPGPFGCATVNIDGHDPYSCGFDQTKKRNNGRYLAMADRMTSIRHAHSNKMPSDVSEIIRSSIQISEEIYCDFSDNTETGVRGNKLFDVLLRGENSIEGAPREKVVKFYKKLSRDKHRKRSLTDTYLDPNALLSQDKNISTREVYPIVNFEHSTLGKSPRALMRKVFAQKDWLGFAVVTSALSPTPNFSENFEAPIYEGSYGGVLYLNDKLVCEKIRFHPTAQITDFSSSNIFTIK